MHPYRTLLSTYVCPVPFAGAPAGEPAQALGDGVTDVALCCMRVGARHCVCVCVCVCVDINMPFVQ